MLQINMEDKVDRVKNKKVFKKEFKLDKIYLEKQGYGILTKKVSQMNVEDNLYGEKNK